MTPDPADRAAWPGDLTEAPISETRVLRNTNVVVYCMSKVKSSAAYNQTATYNIISIVKTGGCQTIVSVRLLWRGKEYQEEIDQASLNYQ